MVIGCHYTYAIECPSEGPCPEPTPICDPVQKICVQCVQTTDCDDETQICENNQCIPTVTTYTTKRLDVKFSKPFNFSDDDIDAFDGLISGFDALPCAAKTTEIYFKDESTYYYHQHPDLVCTSDELKLFEDKINTPDKSIHFTFTPSLAGIELPADCVTKSGAPQCAILEQCSPLHCPIGTPCDDETADVICGPTQVCADDISSTGKVCAGSPAYSSYLSHLVMSVVGVMIVYIGFI